MASGLLVCMQTYPKAFVPMNCAYTGGRLLRDTASFVAQQAQDYIDTLQTLCRSLSDHASVSAAAKIYRVFGKVEAIGKVNRSCNLFSRVMKSPFRRGPPTSERD